MKIRRKIVIALVSLIATTTPLLYAGHVSGKWEEAKGMNGNFKAVVSQPDIEVFSAPNIIMVKLNKESEIRLFTILGKLISNDYLQPGIFQYKMDTHGIYIIKTDEMSCKIAI